MATPRPTQERRRPRRGSVHRPIDGRVYRGAWILAAVALIVAALSLRHPTALPAPALPPSFDAAAAAANANEIAKYYPNRTPGSTGNQATADWLEQKLQQYGYRPTVDHWRSALPGGGEADLVNITAVAPGRSQDSIVVTAHRDDLGLGPGANANAAGTAALLELARAYANLGTAGAQGRLGPAHSIVFLSTDGGAFGGLGAEHFAERARAQHVLAVVNLDGIAGKGPPRIEIGGDTPRSPSPILVATAVARVAQQAKTSLRHPSTIGQLLDLGFPFALYEQGPLIARGVSAITLTAEGDRPQRATNDPLAGLSAARLGDIGRSTQQLIASLDAGIDLGRAGPSYLWLGQRYVPGWAVKLVLAALTLPFIAAALDLLARCRRRHVRIAPAFRALRSRALFWLWVAGAFFLVAELGGYPAGPGRPIPLDLPGAGALPAGGLIGLGVLILLGWALERHRLVPRRPTTQEEEIAGQAAALVGLAVVGLLVAATNVYSLLFVLPSMHLWVWLPQLADRPRWTRLLLLASGFAGPALLVGAFAVRYQLGLSAPWYLATLVSSGYASAGSFLVFCCWLAVAAQLAAVAAGRYAPYPPPSAREFGPVRTAVRAVLLIALGRRPRPTSRGAGSASARR